MNYCCEKLEKFIKDSACGDGYTSIIYQTDDKYYIVEEVRSCDDGDNRIDTWVDEKKQIFYCPFCGKVLI